MNALFFINDSLRSLRAVLWCLGFLCAYFGILKYLN
jgi:hypothetical protein